MTDVGRKQLVAEVGSWKKIDEMANAPCLGCELWPLALHDLEFCELWGHTLTLASIDDDSAHTTHSSQVHLALRSSLRTRYSYTTPTPLSALQTDALCALPGSPPRPPT